VIAFNKHLNSEISTKIELSVTGYMVSLYVALSPTKDAKQS